MTQQPRTPTTMNRDFKRGFNLVYPVLRAIVRGERKPTPADLILLRGLRDELRKAPR